MSLKTSNTRKNRYATGYTNHLRNKRRRWKKCNPTSKYKTYDDAVKAQGGRIREKKG